jgi:hypothetical protein
MKRKRPKNWYREVARVMLRQNLPFRAAAAECGIVLTPEEAEKHARRAAFLEIYQRERFEYYAQLGASTYRGREGLIGQMQYLIDQLISAGQYDKALDGVAKLARVARGDDIESTTDQIAGLTPAQIEELRKSIASRVGKGPRGDLQPLPPDMVQ